MAELSGASLSRQDDLNVHTHLSCHCPVGHPMVGINSHSMCVLLFWDQVLFGNLGLNSKA